jgi:hypothetical protein
VETAHAVPYDDHRREQHEPEHRELQQTRADVSTVNDGATGGKRHTHPSDDGKHKYQSDHRQPATQIQQAPNTRSEGLRSRLDAKADGDRLGQLARRNLVQQRR